MSQEANYTILFKALRDYTENKNNDIVLKVIEQGNYLKQFYAEEPQQDFIGYTKT